MRDFDQNCIGQAERQFKTRIKQHLSTFRSNSNALNMHDFYQSRTLESTDGFMKIVYVINEGNCRNTVEKYYAYT